MGEYHLGVLLKEIRVSRKMTLETLADNILSIAQLSKFENGKTNITVDKLLQLLDRLNITYEEFFAEAKKFTKSHIESLSVIMSRKYIEQDVHALNTLYKSQVEAYEKTNIQFYNLNSIIIASLLENLTKEKRVTESMRNEVSEYLFEVENWRSYEVLLFGNCIHILKLSMLKMITGELLKSPILSVQTSKNRQMKIQLLYNVALKMIEADEVQFTKQLINEIKSSLENDESLLLDRLRVHYLEGYLNYHCGERAEGIRLMKETLDTLDIFDCQNLKRNFNSHFNKIIKFSDYS